MKFIKLNQEEQESILNGLELRLSVLETSSSVLPLEQQIKAFKTAYMNEYKEYHAMTILKDKEIESLKQDIENLKRQIT